jgi:hypothetical protein
MDAILFSANPSMVDVDDAIQHLASHAQLYWEVGFPIKKEAFVFPILGYIHVCGDRVQFKVVIERIEDFSPTHYEDSVFARTVKPEPWIREWAQNIGNTRSRSWKHALVLTMIQPFSCDTTAFAKIDGSPVTRPPQGYIRVLPWGGPAPIRLPSASAFEATAQTQKKGRVRREQILERNLEDLLIQQLESIEPGLKLVGRQLGTPAGRLDILVQDSSGHYVVIELKRTIGRDQVVGQILRYMGWVSEKFKADKVRGIIVVGDKDPLLAYAAKVVPNLTVKKFIISVK